jgi:YHS domain-containing protein
MKTLKLLAVLTLALPLLVLLQSVRADEKKETAKAYPLTTCIVTGEKLDADPGMKSYSFVHEGQEIKLCCKGCLKDFKKEPAKYLKKLEKPADDKAKK